MWSYRHKVVRKSIVLEQLSYSMSDPLCCCYFHCMKVQFSQLLPLPYSRSFTLEMPQGTFTLEPAMVSISRTQKTVHGGCAVCAS